MDKFLLYFNLPYDYIVKRKVEPRLVFEVSHDNDEIRTSKKIESLIDCIRESDEEDERKRVAEIKNLKRSRAGDGKKSAEDT